jgi:LysR family transcriptional regulator for metE and metH
MQEIHGLSMSTKLRLELRDWRMVQAIAQENSVTRAADRLGLSQSALSHQLVKLEGDLGLRLFDRVGKRMAPTPTGSSLALAAGPLLDQLAVAEEVIALGRAAPAPTPLRVATSCFSYYTWLAQTLAAFGGLRPDIDLHIQLQATREELSALDQDRVDFVITAHPPKRPDFEQMEVFSQEVVAIAATDHPVARLAAAGKGVAWSDLRGHTLLIHDLPSMDEDALRDAVWGADARRTPAQSVRRVQLTEAITALARGGFGVGVMNCWLGAAPFDMTGLVETSIVPRHDRRYWAVWRRANPRALPLRELAASIRDQA